MSQDVVHSPKEDDLRVIRNGVNKLIRTEEIFKKKKSLILAKVIKLDQDYSDINKPK